MKLSLPSNWRFIDRGSSFPKLPPLLVYPCKKCWRPASVSRSVYNGAVSYDIGCDHCSAEQVSSPSLVLAVSLWNERPGGLVSQLFTEVSNAAMNRSILPVHIELAKRLGLSNWLQALAGGNPEEIYPLSDEVSTMFDSFRGEVLE